MFSISTGDWESDGLSLGSILLTGFITTLATLAAWPVTRNSQLFYFLMLAMYIAKLIPVYLLLSMWGGKRRLYSATKFILYTAGGSIFFLIGVLGMGLYGSNEPGLDLERLINQSIPYNIGNTTYMYAFSRNSIKDGSIRLIRVNMELLPHAHLSIFLGCFNFSWSTKFQKRIAYSSVSHMGFIIIGIGSITNIGLNGAIYKYYLMDLSVLHFFFLAGTACDRMRLVYSRRTGGNIYPNAKNFTMV
ncbi:hypothetical protein ACJX0J_004489 [Zea mays]